MINLKLAFFLIIISFISIYFFSRTRNIYNQKLFKENNTAIVKSKEKQIPKVLYKISPVKTEMIPELTNLLDKIKKQNPDYTLSYFDETKCIDFLKKHFEPDVLEAFNSLIPPAYKCDLMRYCILYIKGGVYGDLFQDYYKPLNQIINHEKDNMVLVQDRLHYLTSIFSSISKFNLNGIQISFMATTPLNPLYRECINKIVENVKIGYYGNSSLEPTGPLLFSKLFQENYLDTDYKLVLKFNGNSIVNYKTEKKIIEPKIEGHTKVINENLKYSVLWKNKKIYK